MSWLGGDLAGSPQELGRFWGSAPSPRGQAPEVCRQQVGYRRATRMVFLSLCCYHVTPLSLFFLGGISHLMLKRV